MKHKLLIVSGLLFVLHQILEKGLSVHFTLIDSYLDDLLCIPLIIFLWNWEKSILLNIPTYKIPLPESIVLTITLSLLFELVFPLLSTHFTFDYYDFVAYGLGLALYWVFEWKNLYHNT